MTDDTPQPCMTFDSLNLPTTLLKALKALGYETPSPIQAKIIPFLLAGRDVLGQAQTGTGKTAAFALPLLAQLNLKHLISPQILVLAPTRELAIQVAEAFQRYAVNLPGFHVVPIYGGQDYATQIKQLKRGVHVVVGTPGRVLDHIRRGTLKLDGLSSLVLDEADEMLRMGFIEDVEWVLQQISPTCRIALFSATMPDAIRRIANKHLKQAEYVTIKVRTTTAETIRQRYWEVSNANKLDALTRLLEIETFEGILIFVRTKTAALELAQKLSARGYSAAPLSGDIAQTQRMRTVEQLKNGKLDIVVATDVAARGLDVERISHVINFDIPQDTESYVHRIGRTGRAGRKGEAILFVAPREKRMLAMIEKATRQVIERMQAPSTQLINDKRVSRFMQRITESLSGKQNNIFCEVIEKYQQENNSVTLLEIAGALAAMAQGEIPLLMSHKPTLPEHTTGRDEVYSGGRNADSRERPARRGASAPLAGNLVNFRLDVGSTHGVKPGNLVGAIANETGLTSKQMGKIEIFEEYSTINLPSDMTAAQRKKLNSIWVANRQLKPTEVGQSRDKKKNEYSKRKERNTGRKERN